MRHFLFFTAALLSGCVSKPPEWQGPPIVHMTCPGVKSVAIIPTMHSYGGPIPPNIKAEVKSADVVFLEIDVETTPTEFGKLLAENKKPLPPYVPVPDDWLAQLDSADTSRLERLLQRNGFSLVDIGTMIPQTGYAKVFDLIAKDGKAAAPNIKNVEGDVFDGRIQQLAKKNGKEIVGLETAEEVFSLAIRERDAYVTDRVGTLANRLKANAFVFRLTSTKDSDFYESLILGSLDDLRAEFTDYESIEERETGWVVRLKSGMVGKRVVIAVGANHVSPALGLPAKLVSEMGCIVRDESGPAESDQHFQASHTTVGIIMGVIPPVGAWVRAAVTERS